MAFSSMIKCLLFAASLTSLLASPFESGNYNHLLAGEKLFQGCSLINGELRLIMQRDCNLVLYNSDKPIWASKTNDRSSGCDLSFQQNGNLIIHDYNNHFVWESGTGRGNGKYILVLQKDRNLVIYSDLIWFTETNDGGSAGDVVAAARNGMVGFSGMKQNKGRKMGKIIEVINEE